MFQTLSGGREGGGGVPKKKVPFMENRMLGSILLPPTCGTPNAKAGVGVCVVPSR